MPSKSKREQLQEFAERLTDESVHHLFTIEYRAGWWAVASETRWFGDRGEYLGSDLETAKATLTMILG